MGSSVIVVIVAVIVCVVALAFLASNPTSPQTVIPELSVPALAGPGRGGGGGGRDRSDEKEEEDDEALSVAPSVADSDVASIVSLGGEDYQPVVTYRDILENGVRYRQTMENYLRQLNVESVPFDSPDFPLASVCGRLMADISTDRRRDIELVMRRASYGNLPLADELYLACVMMRVDRGALSRLVLGELATAYTRAVANGECDGCREFFDAVDRLREGWQFSHVLFWIATEIRVRHYRCCFADSVPADRSQEPRSLRLLRSCFMHGLGTRISLALRAIQFYPNETLGARR